MRVVRVIFSRNPTHGSGWMFQAPPTNQLVIYLLESHPRKMDCSHPALPPVRFIQTAPCIPRGRCQSIPPTSVGGIPRAIRRRSL